MDDDKMSERTCEVFVSDNTPAAKLWEFSRHTRACLALQRQAADRRVDDGARSCKRRDETWSFGLDFSSSAAAASRAA